jgi:hypothetical protein
VGRTLLKIRGAGEQQYYWLNPNTKKLYINSDEGGESAGILWQCPSIPFDSVTAGIINGGSTLQFVGSIAFVIGIYGTDSFAYICYETLVSAIKSSTNVTVSASSRGHFNITPASGNNYRYIAFATPL